MDFLRRAPGSDRPQRRVAVLPAAFHPPTVAHVELARAATDHVDEVLFVLPRAFPHKDLRDQELPLRASMIQAIAETHDQFSAAICDGGLYIEIAREARDAYGRQSGVALLCGRDAAERIIQWTYPPGFDIESGLQEFELLVACRQGVFDPPASIANRVRHLSMDPSFDEISSTEVRRRIREGDLWTHLVPEPCHEIVTAHLNLFN